MPSVDPETRHGGQTKSPQLYRTMSAGADGNPNCGTGNTDLGVRPGPGPGDDVNPDPRGLVGPGGGMSTFVHPKYLPKFLRPESLGGMSRLPVFKIVQADLSAFALIKKKKHVQVEPRSQMPLEQLLTMLCATRTSWKEHP